MNLLEVLPDVFLIAFAASFGWNLSHSVIATFVANVNVFFQKRRIAKALATATELETVLEDIEPEDLDRSDKRYL